MASVPLIGRGVGGWAGAVFEATCLESRILRVRTPLWHSSFYETKWFFPAHTWRFNIVGSLRDREVACSASDRQESNFESWPSLAYMCTKVAYHPIHSFHFCATHRSNFTFTQLILSYDVTMVSRAELSICQNNYYIIFNTNYSKA